MVFEVVKIVKLMSEDLDELIEFLNMDSGNEYEIYDTPADQIVLAVKGTDILMEEKIYVRQMCNGTHIYVLEYRER